MAEKKNPGGNENSGRKSGQKMKQFLIYHYLLRKSDENNVIKTTDICTELGVYEISAEERSVRKDIDEINKAILVAEGIAVDMLEAEELCKKEKNRAIVYDDHRRGFYMQKRRDQMNDLYAIVDCISAAPFLDKDTVSRLVDMVCNKFVSEKETNEIKESIYVPHRTISDCTPLLKNLEKIRLALKKTVDGQAQIPERIKFDYMEYQIQDVANRSSRSRKRAYVVDPHMIFLKEGNHYLWGTDVATNRETSFCVERMKNIKLCASDRYILLRVAETRAHIDEYSKHRLGGTGYNTHGMHMTLQFEKSLLETVIEKFGVLDAIYAKGTDNQFTVTTRIPSKFDMSQFFGWICGFEGTIKIIEPFDLKYEYDRHLRRQLRKIY